MLAEMTATELQEWRVRASIDAEINDVYQRLKAAGTNPTYAEARKRIFRKYTER